MISINYQQHGSSGFQLRLRLYQDGETRYISVTKYLKGSIQRKHWSQKKQYLRESCPFEKENNEFLSAFIKKYREAAQGWQGTVLGLVQWVENGEERSDKPTFMGYLEKLIEQLKTKRHPDGTMKGTYEDYGKMSRRFEEFCQSRQYPCRKLLLSDLTPKLVDEFFDWISKTRKGKGARYNSVTLHATLARADKEGLLSLDDFKGCNWAKKKRGSWAKNHSLSPSQCRKLVEMSVSELPASPRAELYRDICVFLLYTGQSLCDALSLRNKDIRVIKGVEHFVFLRRKIEDKQTDPCSVPINPVMKEIMKRWKRHCCEDYVFPVRTKRGAALDSANSETKRFLVKMNEWLKELGKTLGCDFPLHTYAFRHTAITRYISKGVPIAYVASIMGTSVQNCEKIYFDSAGDHESRNKVLQAVSF